jgi:hypothetical protein
MVLSGLLMGLPTALIFTYKSYVQGILTPDRLAYIFFVCAIESVAFGAFVWVAIAKPAMDRKSKR